MSGRPRRTGPALPILGEDWSRRDFMKALGGAAAAAGLQGCWQPPEEPILPYVVQPPEVVPGVPVAYATASDVGGYATGLLIQTREGRPIKVEGNPTHPASLGATGVLEQALPIGLYDPGRLRRIGGRAGPEALSAVLERFRPAGDGAGLAFLLEPTSSPLRGRLLERVQERWPAARIHFHTPVGPAPEVEAYARAAGRSLVPRYDLSRARTVVSMDADFVSARTPFHLRYARDFAQHRAVASPTGEMSRLYVAEPAPSTVTPVADHPLRVRGGDVVFLLAELVRVLGGRAEGLPPAPDRLDTERVRAWVRAAAGDLRAVSGGGVVLVGETQPPAAHLLAHEANRVIGAFGGPVVLQEPALVRADEIAGGLGRLADAIRAGEVDRLVVLEGDPARTAPADLEFAEALGALEDTLYLGLRENATSRRASTTVPALHLFERWGDARAYDGTLTPVQPVIRPLFGGRSVDGLLLELLGNAEASPYDAIRGTWAGEGTWDDVLRRGAADGTAFTPVPPPDLDAAPLLGEVRTPPDGVEIAFRTDPRLYDGRFAGNAWLQELPDPVHKVSWGNGVMMAPSLAASLGVSTGDPVRLEVEGRALEAPALPTPGHAEDALTLTLGHGEEPPPTRYRPLGVDAYRIRPSGAPWHAPVRVAAAGGERWALALAQPEKSMHDRPIVLHGTLAEYREDPDFTGEHRGEQASFYGRPDVGAAEHQWGMTIDLSICTGCSACVVACRAENNVPIVGPEQVRRGRRMDWLRIDAWVVGGDEEPHAHLRQPMLCQHCEDAPCEYVCPTYATVHSDDGLNEMIYNRCVGTRFCSNNCPYKVRRFNWFDFNERRDPLEELALNPDVTVRGRGVMEKCTYCVQRIRRTQIRARAEGRELARDEVVTACQQACPTRAIVFGDLADPESAVSIRREQRRRYAVLHELGTRPRTQYLAHLTNPSPALDTGRAADEVEE